MATEVRHEPERSRYTISLDGRVVGVTEYRDEGATLVFPHTEVDPSLRGRGLGARLVRGALDDVRARGRRVIPACSYVARFIEENPDYRDLLTPVP